MDDLTKTLTKDITELARRLNSHLEFYYSLIEAKHIPLNLNKPMKDYLEVIQVDKAEWNRWQKIKLIIDRFEVPT